MRRGPRGEGDGEAARARFFSTHRRAPPPASPRSPTHPRPHAPALTSTPLPTTTTLFLSFIISLSDVGQPKAVAAARAVEARVAGVTITPHVGRIEDKPPSFYDDFHIIVLGLDSLEARRHMNALACAKLRFLDDGTPDPATITPLIDGGTEGFRGHVRVIVPGMTPCFECTLWLFPPQTTYPLCTLAETPRSPAHCVEYARLILWAEARKDEEFDADVVRERERKRGRGREGGMFFIKHRSIAHHHRSPLPPPHPPFSSHQEEHMDWIHERALARALAHGIPSFPRALTAGVAKRIVPAIASTNAIVAAACALEALKAATMLAPGLDNYCLFSGGDGVYSAVQSHARDALCPLCSPGVALAAPAATPLATWLDGVREAPALAALARGDAKQLAGPTVAVDGGRVLSGGGVYAEEAAANGPKPLGDLLDGGGPHLLILNDRTLAAPVRVRLTLT